MKPLPQSIHHHFSPVVAAWLALSALSHGLPPEPPDPVAVDPSAWKSVDAGIHSGFGSIGVLQARSSPPSAAVADNLTLTGWRGERIHGQLLVWSAADAGRVEVSSTDLRSDDHLIPSGRVSVSAVRYVITSQFNNHLGRSCGPRDNHLIPSSLSPDLLGGERSFALGSRETRPVWVAVDLPPDTAPGTYRGTILLDSRAGRISHAVTVVVQNRTLPPASRWSFHLDLWQNPFVVARHHRVELWSQEHISLLKPLLCKLADAGQKCITATIVHHPWDFDDFQSMVRWTRTSDGTWEYDFGIFDKYVSLAMECGIVEQINCYSMVPVSNEYFWIDAASGKTVSAVMKPGTKAYDDFWRTFLLAFREHMQNKGWLDKTTIALDERGEDDTLSVLRLIRETAPGLKVSLAGFHHEEVTLGIHDFSSNWRHVDAFTADVLDARRSDGRKTTFYVACAVAKPNQFTFSPPAESCYVAWFAAAAGFDGFLRWAYNSWTDNPFTDSRHALHPPGDTFFVYPGALSSVRFERLREGIQDYEKIRILRHELGPSESLKPLNQFLATINRETLDALTAAEIVQHGKDIIHAVSATSPP
jgi:hypothetical protein